MRIATSRRSAALVLLPALLLVACTRLVAVERPEPNQRIESVVLRSGDAIDFRSDERATLEDSAVVVRRGRGDVLRTIAAADVASVFVREADPARTLGALAAVGVGLLIAFMILDDASDGYFTCGC